MSVANACLMVLPALAAFAILSLKSSVVELSAVIVCPNISPLYHIGGI